VVIFRLLHFLNNHYFPVSGRKDVVCILLSFAAWAPEEMKNSKQQEYRKGIREEVDPLVPCKEIGRANDNNHHDDDYDNTGVAFSVYLHHKCYIN